jgi:hypothetical protein
MQRVATVNEAPKAGKLGIDLQQNSLRCFSRLTLLNIASDHVRRYVPTMDAEQDGYFAQLPTGLGLDVCH